MKNTGSVLVVLMVAAIPVAADDAGRSDSSTTTSRHAWYATPVGDFQWPYWRGYFTDSRDLFTGFTHWRASEWILATAAVGTAAGLFVEDDNIRQLVQHNRSPETDRIAMLAKPLGDGRFALPPLAGSYLFGWIFNDPRARDAARFGAESFALSGLIANVVKYSTHRHRPWDNQGPNDWTGLSFLGDDESFPSGHATTAFSIAGVIAEVYRDNYAVPIVAYSLATLVGLSRINDDAHWASDVFAGALLGLITAHTVIWAERRDVGRKIYLVPTFKQGRTGGALVARF